MNVIPPSTFTSQSSTSELTMADLLRAKRMIQAQNKRHWTGHDKAQWVRDFPDYAKPWERVELDPLIHVSAVGAQAAVDALQKISRSFSKAISEATDAKSIKAIRSR